MAIEDLAGPSDVQLLKLIYSLLGLELPDHEAFTREMAATLRKRCGPPIHPLVGESLAFSLLRPKVAALAFDRVYRVPLLLDPVPEEIGFFGGSLVEFAFCALPIVASTAEEVGFKIDSPPKPSPKDAVANEYRSLHILSSDLRATFDAEPTVFYANQDACSVDYPTGPQAVLAAAISNLELADEGSLSWQQVLDFRRDKEARRKYRRLLRWLDSELQSKTPAEVAAAMEERLDNYNWAIRKHGIATAVGALSCLLEPKVLGGISAAVSATALVAGAPWAVLTGASLAVGKSLISIGTTYVTGIDERRKGQYEIAYIHDVQNRL